MRPHLQSLLMIVSALVGLGLAFSIFTTNLPVYLGWVYGDYPDPDRPGHLKGAIVSGPELFGEIGVMVLCLGIAFGFWRSLRRLDGAVLDD